MTARTQPRPTHWTKALDPETGEPCLVRAENYTPDEIGGELPEYFEDAYFDWRPKHDPNGQWVEREAEHRDAIWAATKVVREQRKDANVRVSIGGQTYAFQADASSRGELQSHLAAYLFDPEGFAPIEFDTAGNATVLLDGPALGKIIRAISDQRNAAQKEGRDARKRIFDVSKPMVRSLPINSVDER